MAPDHALLVCPFRIIRCLYLSDQKPQSNSNNRCNTSFIQYWSSLSFISVMTDQLKVSAPLKPVSPFYVVQGW